MNQGNNYKFIVMDGPNPGSEYELIQNEITIGRDPNSDWTIDITSVSRAHAKLTKSGSSYLIEDLGSSNGTFVNGSKLSGPYLLSGGDEVKLGQSVIIKFVDKQPTKLSGATRESVVLGELASTTIGDIQSITDPSIPKQLSVTVAGSSPESYKLTKDKLTFGRSADNDIVVNSPIVSKEHGYLERTGDGGYQLVVLPSAGNPVYLDGRAVTEPTRLNHNTKLRIGGQDPGVMISMVYDSPGEAVAASEEIIFGDKSTIQIGRDSTNDVVLNVSQVSRFHALIEKIGQRYKVKDLGSTNGTFVNDQRITGEVRLNPDDTVRIGPYRYVMGAESMAQYDDSIDLRVEAIGLNKWVLPDLNILQHISLVMEPREFIVVVGQSGGGKSTLVDAIAGYRPATHGEVFVNDTNVYENFDAIRNIIGFVPQKDIIHMELTVYDALDFTAQLRMTSDTTPEERHQRIMEVMDDLDIAHRKDNQIKELSGGQQKRVSIGVELLTKPGLFFLDEPTSGLDPGTETALMHLMRQMADQGRTIILITHATKNVVLADKVVFLARGGHLVWYGPPEDSLAYFDQFRSEQDRRKGPMEFDQIYAILEKEEKGTPEQWGERYRQNKAYQKYIVDALNDSHTSVAQKMEAVASSTPRENAASSLQSESGNQISSLEQFIILSKRNVRILTRDRFSLGLMLAASPIVGLLSVLLALILGNNPFDFSTGSMTNIIITMFLLTIYGVMVGGLSQMREIVKEAEIYRRERLVNLKIVPYIMSKVWVATVLAIYQAGTYTIIHYIGFDMPGGVLEFFLIWITLAFATMAGMMLGLFASALSPNANAAPLIVILFMLPQIVLGGALVPLPEFVSSVTSSKWALQGFMAITGVGSDLVSDVCWSLTPEQRAAMTADAKTADCQCLGTNALREETCNFPGIGAFYNEAIDQVQPVAPGGEPERPPDLEIPDPPPEPEDQSDTVAMADYFADLQEYQIEAERLQEETKAAFAQYEAEIEVYQAKIVAYQSELIEYQTAVAGAVGPAESTLALYQRDFGWAFVDKNDPGQYWPFLIKTWFAQIVIMSILLGGILFLQKRKDVI